MSSDMVPLPTRSWRNTRPSRARRIETAGRDVTPITADNREPSGSRRSSCGLAESNGRLVRPAWAASTWISSTSSSSLSATGPGRLLATVAVLDEDLVAAVDVDVLDLGVVDQRLQPADTEQRRVDRAGDLRVVVRRRRRAALGQLVAGVVLEHLDDQRAGVLALVLGAHRRYAVHLVAAALLVQPLGDLDPQLADQLLISAHRLPSHSPAGRERGLGHVEVVLRRRRDQRGHLRGDVGRGPDQRRTVEPAVTAPVEERRAGRVVGQVPAVPDRHGHRVQHGPHLLDAVAPLRVRDDDHTELCVHVVHQRRQPLAQVRDRRPGRRTDEDDEPRRLDDGELRRRRRRSDRSPPVRRPAASG